MVWFKVDDSFYDHPKVFDAPDCAVALWTRAGTWSARNLTNGFVPTGMPARLCDDPDTAVKELVRRGLWLRATGGWKFHDWPEYQPSKEAVEDLRAKRAEAGRKGGQAKAAKQNASNGLANASDVGKQNAAPTRPVPSPSGLGSGFSNGEASSILEPPPRCPKHLDNPTEDPCRPCGDARSRHEAWATAEAERSRQQTLLRASQTARDRAEATRQAIQHCQRCDHLGRLPSRGICNHEPEASPTAAAAAREAARAAAGRRPERRDALAALDDALADVIPIRPEETPA